MEEKLYGGMTLSVPDESVTSTDWHYEVNEDGSYSVVNTNTIAATSKAMFQFTITDILPQDEIDQANAAAKARKAKEELAKNPKQ